MKIHLTAKTVTDADGNVCKIPDGSMRFSNLPRGGLQRIHVDSLKAGGALAKHHTQTPTHITVHSKEGDVIFKILEQPGRYCLTCGDKLSPFAGNGTEAEAAAAQKCLAHVKSHGKTAETSEKYPHGYNNHSFSYHCEIVENDLSKRLMAGA